MRKELAEIASCQCRILLSDCARWMTAPDCSVSGNTSAASPNLCQRSRCMCLPLRPGVATVTDRSAFTVACFYRPELAAIGTLFIVGTISIAIHSITVRAHCFTCWRAACHRLELKALYTLLMG